MGRAGTHKHGGWPSCPQAVFLGSGLAGCARPGMTNFAFVYTLSEEGMFLMHQ
jgi:hypothetical protein